MKLKNEALKKLYDKITSGTFVFTPSGHDPIDELFKECDGELSDSITFEQIKNLQSDVDIYKRSNEALLSANMEAISKNRKLEKDLNDAKKRLDYFTQSRDDWRSRAKHAEEDVEDLKAALTKANADRTELQKDRDSYHELYTELSKTYNKLSEENKKLKARGDSLHEEVLWYRKHYKEQSDKIQELKSRLNSMYGIKKLRDDAHDIGYKQGQTDLWDKLQNVNDAKPWNIDIASFYPDVSSMDDILSWDLEDFLDAYKSWQEKKEQERIDDMRGYLGWFCMGRACYNCPLRTDEFKCGRGKWFYDMTYEELKKHYEKVIGCPFKRKDD